MCSSMMYAALSLMPRLGRPLHLPLQTLPLPFPPADAPPTLVMGGVDDKVTKLHHELVQRMELLSDSLLGVALRPLSAPGLSMSCPALDAGWFHRSAGQGR